MLRQTRGTDEKCTLYEKGIQQERIYQRKGTCTCKLKKKIRHFYVHLPSVLHIILLTF